MLLLIAFFVITVESQLMNMIVLWGYPSNSNGKRLITVDSWNSCVSTCYNNPRCIVAYSKTKIQSTECYVFYIGEVAKIQMNSDGNTDNRIVAVKKININKCAASNFGSFPITGSTTDGFYKANRIVETGQNVLNFTYITQCEPGWTRFARIKGLACLQVFNRNLAKQEDSVSLCKAVGAVLSGIENQNEANWIHESAFPFLSPMQKRWLWIGAERKSGCITLPYTDSCYPMDTATFYWMDPTVTGTDGMTRWLPNAPDTTTNTAKLCLTFCVSNVPTADVEKSFRMKISDTVCDTPLNEKIGYVCSKPPTVESTAAMK